MHTDYIGPDGKKWPSVTQITDVIAKPGLYKWYGELGYDKAKEVMDKAKDIGTATHDAIETYLRDRTVMPTDKLAAACVREFCEPYVKAVGSLEQKVINTDLRYHGTYDAVLTVKDMPVTKRSKDTFSGDLLVDWKTAGAIYDTNGIQLGLYYGAGTLPHAGLVVRIDKDTEKVYWKLFQPLDCYFDVGKQLRSVWDFVNKQGAWEH